MAKEAPEDEFAGLAPTDLLQRGELPFLDALDALDPDPAELRTRALEAENAALSVPGITNSSGCGASASASTVALATSGGFAGAYRASGHGCSAAVIAGEGGTMQRDHAWHSARHLQDLESAEAIGLRAGMRAVARLNPGKPKPGKYPVIFDPRVSSTLLGHFAGAISGAAIARKTSFLQDLLRANIFASGVTIVDDPLRRRGLRSRPFDGEGLAVSRQELVSDGVLNGWIAESASARQLGVAPTGHASRGVGGAPGVAPTNLYMAPGGLSPAELMEDVRDGFYVTELIGMGVNGVTGDYSRGAGGYWIENGQLTYPVSEVTIAGNLKDMYKHLTPASDLVFRYGTDAPTLRVDGMTVAGA